MASEDLMAYMAGQDGRDGHHQCAGGRYNWHRYRTVPAD